MLTKACRLREIVWFFQEVLVRLISEHLGSPCDACADGSQEQGLSALDAIVADRHVANGLVSRPDTVVRH